ncbi:zinc-dependent metalloprotease [Tenacibaculum sp. 190524A02b]|uniref:zinc-dependent metalloprotease n=1 Tax=Tenacibaculum vairaonense TaxID=3137860 RepID=UPI0031FAAC0F
MRKLVPLLLLLIGFTIKANAQKRSCGVDALMEKRMQNPEFKAKYFEREILFKENLKSLKTEGKLFRKESVVIPVAIHFPAGSESNRACLEALSQSQIDILNKDFSGTNQDISLWESAKSHYPGVNTGSVNVRFVIATKNHPSNTDSDLVEGGKAVTIGYNFGGGQDTDVKWKGYLNVVVKDIEGLGYASLGGLPKIGDAVVIDNAAFGSGEGCTGFVPGNPYNKGRTLTHELGHYLNLPHTFSGDCSSDDGVADTPNIDESSGGCPAPGSVQMCSNKSLTMNFMDYVNDACMYMFTAGQAERSTAFLSTVKNSYNMTVLSAEVMDMEENLVVYPNPVRENLTIKLGGQFLKEQVQVQLFDLLGRSVFEFKINENSKISVANLNTGLYLLKLSTDNNTITKRIIVE